MKKIGFIVVLSMFVMFNFVSDVFASVYDMKAQLAAKRQIYKVQIKTLDKNLKDTLNEYSTLMLNEKISEKDKEKKMSVLEKQIIEINIKKRELKENYMNEKKEIKEMMKIYN